MRGSPQRCPCQKLQFTKGSAKHEFVMYSLLRMATEVFQTLFPNTFRFLPNGYISSTGCVSINRRPLASYISSLSKWVKTVSNKVFWCFRPNRKWISNLLCTVTFFEGRSQSLSAHAFALYHQYQRFKLTESSRDAPSMLYWAEQWLQAHLLKKHNGVSKPSRFSHLWQSGASVMDKMCCLSLVNTLRPLAGLQTDMSVLVQCAVDAPRLQ